MHASGRTIGVDTGGTFTDLVLVEGERVSTAKLPSTPSDPALALERGLAELGGPRRADVLVHGTTVALNALLTGRIARVALVTNEGFADLLEIGRQERPEIYALHPEKPRPLVPRSLRFEVRSRLWPRADGRGFETVREPSAAELARLARAIRASGAESIAICLLHSWGDPRSERRLARALVPLGLPITTSSGILPAHREVERFSTAVANAALVPELSRYLAGLERRAAPGRLRLLQSSGGTLDAARAAREPARIVFSGPAGGVVGAAAAAAEAGLGAIVGLDMGGTSTDVSFLDAPARPPRARGGRAASASGRIATVRGASTVGGALVALSALDIHAIGCGGGSLVGAGAGGVLAVGPESAGADPGPVAYGRSDRPTLTDAHVWLGHVAEGPFLGGGLALDADAVRRAFERLARELGTRPEATARGVLEVARASMRRAIGVMTLQRGRDPRASSLVAFGGAGGLHAAALAGELGMRSALVPLHPGLTSALGMTRAGASAERLRTLLVPLARVSSAARARVYAELARAARAELRETAPPARGVLAERSLELRYRGQSHEIRLPHGPARAAAFHRAHEELYGYALPDREVELVALRLVLVARAAAGPRGGRLRPRRLAANAVRGVRFADFGRRLRVPVIDRARLAPGTRFEGPALVEEFSGTTLVPPRWRASVTAGGHLLLERAGAG
jgi:N-methylhydantoinase A